MSCFSPISSLPGAIPTGLQKLYKQSWISYVMALKRHSKVVTFTIPPYGTSVTLLLVTCFLVNLGLAGCKPGFSTMPSWISCWSRGMIKQFFFSLSYGKVQWKKARSERIEANLRRVTSSFKLQQFSMKKFVPSPTRGECRHIYQPKRQLYWFSYGKEMRRLRGDQVGSTWGV